jgi:Nucleotidyl transferase AbiEii toxin, Type IV TA system
MTALFWQTVTPGMRQVMSTFGSNEIGQRFYLAGGTALALQLGHRRSVDLDYFSRTEDIPSLKGPLRDALAAVGAELADSAWGKLVFLAGGIRVGFYGYGYDLLQPFLEAEGSHHASLTDIALMKLDALLGRAARKDFHDLYAICQQLPLRDLLKMAPRKYPGVRDFETQAVKRLVYFERADEEPPLPLLEPVTWETVKAYFRLQATEIGRGWIAEG